MKTKIVSLCLMVVASLTAAEDGPFLKVDDAQEAASLMRFCLPNDLIFYWEVLEKSLDERLDKNQPVTTEELRESCEAFVILTKVRCLYSQDLSFKGSVVARLQHISNDRLAEGLSVAIPLCAMITLHQEVTQEFKELGEMGIQLPRSSRWDNTVSHFPPDEIHYRLKETKRKARLRAENRMFSLNRLKERVGLMVRDLLNRTKEVMPSELNVIQDLSAMSAEELESYRESLPE